MEFGIYLNQYHDECVDFDFADIHEQVDVMESRNYDVAAAGQRRTRCESRARGSVLRRRRG